MRTALYVIGGALVGPLALVVILVPIEIVYQLGGTKTQAMYATSVWCFMLSGACFGWTASNIRKNR